MQRIFRTNKNDNFTIIDNQVLRAVHLSLEAKGLLAFMLTFPDDWVFNMVHLSTALPESKTRIRRILNELIKQQYIHRATKRDKNGKITAVRYYLTESPALIIELKNSLLMNINFENS